jgi:hypothetical protein
MISFISVISACHKKTYSVVHENHLIRYFKNMLVFCVNMVIVWEKKRNFVAKLEGIFNVSSMMSWENSLFLY